MKQKGNILIIDDDRDIVNALEIILSMEKYHTSTAFNGTQSLKTLHQDQPDLILLDYMLPDMNGAEVVKKIREDKKYANLPIILISAAHGVEQLGKTLDVQDWIEKPFELEQLLTTVAKYL